MLILWNFHPAEYYFTMIIVIFKKPYFVIILLITEVFIYFFVTLTKKKEKQNTKKIMQINVIFFSFTCFIAIYKLADEGALSRHDSDT